MIRRRAGVVALLLALAPTSLVRADPAQPAMPRFRYDTGWLKLPAGLATGEVTAVAVDRQDHLWVLHRPRTVKDRAAAAIASPILEFDAEGRYLRGFGGPAAGYEWPTTEHSLAIGGDGHVWIGGSAFMQAENGDDMLLEFDRAGRFVRQIGRRGQSGGNADTRNVHAPADIFVDTPRRDVYVADGYGNQRVIVFDARTGGFRRMWGAFGGVPARPTPGTDTVRGPATFNGVHGVEKARDGQVYVSDRMNRRIQVFDANGTYRAQGFVNPAGASPLTASGMAFSRDRDQTYLFVADWGNSMLFVLDRRTLRTIGSIGRRGTGPGEFNGPHLIDIDSKGVIYVAEVQGRRVQRLVPEQP